MPADVECAKRTFNVLALTKNYNALFFWTPLSLFIYRNFSLRIHTADAIPH